MEITFYICVKGIISSYSIKYLETLYAEHFHKIYALFKPKLEDYCISPLVCLDV